jgi:hypothetical protein
MQPAAVKWMKNLSESKTYTQPQNKNSSPIMNS